MKKIFLTAALVLSCSLFVSAAVVLDDSQVIDPFTLDSELANKVLVDVRIESDYWDHGKIEGSVEVALHDLLVSDKLPAKNADIVVISQDGNAGEIAVLALNKLGYTKVQNLDGGIGLWKMMGMPTIEVPRPASAAPVAGGC